MGSSGFQIQFLLYRIAERMVYVRFITVFCKEGGTQETANDIGFFKAVITLADALI